VIEGFNRANLQLHHKKCVFAQPQVNYLGYVLTQDGIAASPDKVKAMKEYPEPKIAKYDRSFLSRVHLKNIGSRLR
jgi:non-ribosomal peptide synthetase component E (peptide arylation enzyme)